ncbi:longitudinals lacking protein [Zeugodacus cucurbitae]|uniref:longitudinals lacking protein n=1 Tax=Zeugodacus cucurbitae TaxID=28588 RepID=UPI0023D8F740|nr:longitudinals lacking protein [Zeugodacus cucurbitae]
MAPEVAAPGLSPHTIPAEPPLKRGIVPPQMNRKNMSVTDVSDMLINLYKTNVANAPKNQQTTASKFRQTSPTSAEGHEPSSIAAIATKGAAAAVNEPKNLQIDEMMTVANERQQQQQQATTMVVTPDLSVTAEHASFHQANTENANIMKVNQNPNVDNNTLYGLQAGGMPAMSAIPTSVVVAPNDEPLDIKPVINPQTGQVIPMLPNAALGGVGASVIKPVPNMVADSTMPSLAPLNSALERANAINSQHNNAQAGVLPGGCDALPPAAVLAAALLRDGYNNFQQQLRTQELFKMNGQADVNNGNVVDSNAANTLSTKILENFLRQRHLKSEGATDNTNPNESDAVDGDDEDDSRYNGFDDIHLIEGSKPNYNNMSGLLQPGGASSSSPHLTSSNTDYMSDDSQKFMFAAQAYRHLEYSLGGENSFGMMSGHESGNNENGTEGPEPIYECRHCGKKYRWKSTLRRHENVECGGKEPSHQCPYCPYKSKQRGNLGVHVRKHHSDLPQLASKRRSKYSNKLDSGNISANASDDSSSKLVIDCSK